MPDTPDNYSLIATLPIEMRPSERMMMGYHTISHDPASPMVIFRVSTAGRMTVELDEGNPDEE